MLEVFSFPLINLNQTQTLYQASQYFVSIREKNNNLIGNFEDLNEQNSLYFALTRGSLCKKALEKFYLCELQ